MAPATASLLAGIPPQHLPGLAGGAVALLLATLFGRRRSIDALDCLLAFSGGVHIGLVFGHASQLPLLGVLFLLNGLAYLALVVFRRERRWWRLSAGLLLFITLAAYLVYTGSGREPPDPVGVLDKLVELVALGLVMLPRQGLGERRLRSVAASGVVLGMTFVAGAALWIEDLASAGQAHGPAACALNHHPGPGTVLRQVPCTVTPEQQAAADQLVAQTRAAIAPYQDVKVALAAGYRPTTPDGSGVVHYGLTRPGRGQPLDPSHPAALVYATTRHGPMLLGAMYQMPAQGQPGPDVGGALTPWHYHTNVCISLPGLFISGLSTPFGQCPPWSIRITTADQLHVWTAPNPNGPFGDLDQAWVRRLART